MLNHGLRFARSFKIYYRYFSSVRVEGIQKKGGISTLKLSLLSIGGGMILGTMYSIYKFNESDAHKILESTSPPKIKQLPNTPPTRKVRYVNDSSGLKIRLYQYETCPFCCKVRSYLDYMGISYDVVEVDAVLRQAIRWSNSYKKVPIVLVKLPDQTYQQMNDSSMIISSLESFLLETNKKKRADSGTELLEQITSYYPYVSFIDENGKKTHDILNKYFLMLQEDSTQTNKDALIKEREWREWTDKHLVHLLSPNVYRTVNEAFQAFKLFAEKGDWYNIFPLWETYIMVYIGALSMYMISKHLKKKYNIEDDVREALYKACNSWLKAIEENGGEFLGGRQPNLADLSVYGVLSSIEGCETFKDLLKHTNISNWYYAVKSQMKQNTLT